MINLVFSDVTAGVLKSFFHSQHAINCFSEEYVCLLNGWLHIGPINCPYDDAQRKSTILDAFSKCNSSEEDLASALQSWNSYIQRRKIFISHIQSSHPIRIWYSSEPYSLCGFYEIVHELFSTEATITTIKLPDWSLCKDAIALRGWGDIAPADIEKYLSLETHLPPSQQRVIAQHWESLKKENATLRAQVNGRLVSVSDDFYDPFILQAAPTNESIQISELILQVIRQFQLGISDLTIYERICSMIESEKLDIIKTSTHPYHNVITYRHNPG